MGREATRHRERRAVYTAIRAGTLSRRLPTPQEVDALFHTWARDSSAQEETA